MYDIQLTLHKYSGGMRNVLPRFRQGNVYKIEPNVKSIDVPLMVF